jgi:hypothetical protein
MRRLASTLLAVAALTGGAVLAPGAADGAYTAHAACKSAKIGGKSKCIARGQFCARAHAKDYRRYGLSCTKKDRNGRYHLE